MRRKDKIIIEELVKAGFINPFELIKRGYDFLKGAREHASPQVRKFLKENGDKTILKINLFRDPINSAIDKVINIISLGQWQKAKNKINVDDMFHLYMVLYLSDGSEWRLEKNEVVSATKVKNKVGLNVDITPTLTVGQMFKNTENKIGKDNMWLYNAKNRNCQIWIRDMLKYNNLLTPDNEKFILQDTETAISHLPNIVEKVINATTDLGARADILRYGKSRYTKKYRRYKK